MLIRDHLSDPTLVALLGVWFEETRPPLGLIDWCLEAGLEGQAEGVKWALAVPDRLICDRPGDRGGPIPSLDPNEPRPEEGPYWYWMRCWELRSWDESDYLLVPLYLALSKFSSFPATREEFGGRFPSMETALCALLDGFASLPEAERRELMQGAERPTAPPQPTASLQGGLYQ